MERKIADLQKLIENEAKDMQKEIRIERQEIKIKFDYKLGNKIFMLISDTEECQDVLELVVSNTVPEDTETAFWKPVSEMQLGAAANKTVVIDKKYGKVIRVED